MHKIFAKPLFLGKKGIFLTECHSTNEELSSRIKNGETDEGMIIYSKHQKSGKGQRGNVWLDEPDKNVLMSVLIKPVYLVISEQYLLNVVIGLGVLKCAGRYLDQTKLSLKWPNDILIENRKISGILIENSIKGNKLENSIVGVGFNLNQSAFGLMSATSLFLETNELAVREEFIENLLLDFEYFLLKLKNGQKKLLLKLYHEKLHLRNVYASYQDQFGEFSGVILGIDDSGKLIVRKGEKIQHYGIKEIKFLS